VDTCADRRSSRAIGRPSFSPSATAKWRADLCCADPRLLETARQAREVGAVVVEPNRDWFR
jgi:hypothetical protein